MLFVRSLHLFILKLHCRRLGGELKIMASNGTPRVSGPISGEQLAEIRARITASNSDSGVSSGVTTPQRTAATHKGLHMPKSGHYEAKETIPNTPLAASVISTVLGVAAGIAATCAVQPVLGWLGEANWTWARPQLGIYLTAWATFHILEFWTTAGWNIQKLSVDGEQACALFEAVRGICS